MKKINKTTMMIFALVLCLSVTIGASLAYFSDYEEALGGATLSLGGKTELYEGEDTNAKNIQITNTGKTNMIVRVGIYGPTEMSEPSATGNWFKGGDGFYYYGKILKPGETTAKDTLVASMSFSWDTKEAPEYDFDVTVVHEGSQALYDGDKLVVPGAAENDPNKWDAAAVNKIQKNSEKEGE